MSSETLDPITFVRMNRITWWVISAMAAAVGFGCWSAGLTIEIGDGWKMLLTIPLCLSISFYYRYCRIDRYISTGAEIGAQLVLVLLLGALLSFAAATANFPYRDAELHTIDGWMGFDWRAYLDFFNTYSFIGYTAHLVYLSINLQPLLLILILTATGHFLRLQKFVLITALALCITIAIFVFTPAVANFAHLGLQRSDFANLSPTCAFEHIRHLEALRNATTHVVKLDDLEGLIIFPSFHAISALLFIWAAWPIHFLRWWISALNLAMIAATPIDGAHYAIDIIGGSVIAVVAITATIRLQRPLLPAYAGGLRRAGTPPAILPRQDKNSGEAAAV